MQAGLAAVTQERDDLAKKLYWAEIARDQHQSAKALAAADAIAARQALTEEKLLRRCVHANANQPVLKEATPLHTMFAPGQVAACCAATL